MKCGFCSVTLDIGWRLVYNSCLVFTCCLRLIWNPHGHKEHEDTREDEPDRRPECQNPPDISKNYSKRWPPVIRDETPALPQARYQIFSNIADLADELH